MKKIIFISFIVSICFLLTTSCNKSDKYTKEIKQLDSIMIAIDSSFKILKQIDTSQAGKNLKEIKNNLKTIETNLKDTLNYENAMLLSEYRSCKKPFQIIVDKCDYYYNELNTAKKQVDNLKHDLSIEKIDASNVNSFMSNEFTYAGKTIESIHLLHTISKMYFEKFDSTKTLTSDFINSLSK